MTLPDQAADDLARRYGAQVAALARARFSAFMQAIQDGADPATALADAQLEFTGAFSESLAAAFSELLQRSVFVKQINDLPVGGLTLSRRLYENSKQVQAEALGVIRRHAKGVIQARALALALYDGYDPKDGIRRPLEGAARAQLPKFLRELTEDRIVRRSLDDVITRGQAQAARIKSAALRAAYVEALAAWERGAAPAALERKLEVAVKEKNRFFANRIAQTELARAHQAQAAAEFMADPQVEILQVLMNPMHPKTDICDLHANANLFGLGPGLYPKALAPRPPFHPFCMCKLRSRPSLNGARWREVPGGAAAYLRSLPEGEAANVMGSRERAAAVLNGASVESVLNAGKDAMYRLARVGDGVGHPLVREVAQSRPVVQDAYEVAKAGGLHAGLLRRYRDEADSIVEKSLRSVERRIAEHVEKIADPWRFVRPGTTKTRVDHLVNSYWPKEVEVLRSEADVLRGMLKERKDG